MDSLQVLIIAVLLVVLVEVSYLVTKLPRHLSVNRWAYYSCRCIWICQ
jgi:hypothetical protein